MLSAEFFLKHGLYVQPNFLDSQTCEHIRSVVTSSVVSHPTAVVNARGLPEVDENQRKAQRRDVPPSTSSLVENRLLGLKPRMEHYFQQDFKGFSPIQFLAYKKGDFQIPHVDSTTELHQPDYVKARKYAVVIFLNEEGEPNTRGMYGGGELTFYGLIDEPRAKKYGFPLKGKAGMLVSFPAMLVHECTPVTYGERYVMISFLN